MRTRIRFNQKAQFNLLIMSFVVITAAVSLLAAPKAALGQIYVGGSSIGEYDVTTGAAINSTLASGSDGTAVAYLALSGNDLYAAAGAGDWLNPPVTHYTVANGLVTSSTTYTLSHWNLGGIALSGNTLYAAYNAADGTDSIGLFNAQTGAAINDSFITGLQVDVVRNLELVGSVLYVANNQAGSVGAYDATTGAAINSSLVSGWDGITGVALKGNSLFVAGSLSGTGTIGEYDATTGAAINSSFVTGLDGPADVAVVGNNLYVVDQSSGTIGEYDATSGAAINSSLISGLSGPDSIVVVPEPSTWAMLAMGAIGLLCFRRR